MKRKYLICFLLLFSINLTLGIAYASKIDVKINKTQMLVDEVKVKVDGDAIKFDVPPIMYKERTMVPLRQISDELGIKLEWIPASKTIKLDNGKKKIEIVIDKTTYKIDNEVKNMPYGVPAIVATVNNVDRTLIPLRFMVEAFDYSVKWNGNTKTAEIESAKDIKNGDKLVVDVDTNLLMRKTPSKSGELVKRLPDETPINAISNSVEKEGITWVKVKDAEGDTGYVATTWVKLDKSASYQINQFAIVRVESSLNVRKESSASSEIIGKLNNGAKVKIVSEVVSAGSYDWVKIESLDKKIKGWVAMDWLVKEKDYKPIEVADKSEALKLNEITIERDSYFMPILNIIGNKKFKSENFLLEKNSIYPDRIVLDVENMDTSIYNSKKNKDGIIVLDYNTYPIKTVRISKNNNKTRIIVDLEKKIKYKIVETEGKNGVSIMFEKDDYYIGDSEHINDSDKTEDKPAITKNSFKSAKIVKYKGESALEIEADKIGIYNITKLERPYRMVIDFEDMKIDSSISKFDISNEFISQVRTSQFQSDELKENKKSIVRVVADLKNPAIVKTETVGNKLYLIFKSENTTYNGISYYHEKEQYSKITFNKVSQFSNQVLGGMDDNTIIVKLDASYHSDNNLVSFDDGFVSNLEYLEKNNEKYALIKLYTGVKYDSVYKNGNLEVTFFIEKPISGKRTVVIDAGHGGLSNQKYNGHIGDSGAVSPYSGMKEKDLNFRVALKLQRELEAKGYNVIMTRSEDVYIALKERANIANMANADAFISLHHNSINDPNVRGIMTLYCPSYKSEVKSIDQYPLAKYIQDSLVSQLGVQDRGVIQRPELVVIRETKMPAVLVELGFLTNEKEEQLVQTESYQNDSAKAIADGLEQYFKNLK